MNFKNRKRSFLWLLAALMALTLSVSLLAACDTSGDGQVTDSTTADGGETVPDVTSPDGTSPDSTTGDPTDSTEPDDSTESGTVTEAPTETPTEPPVITLPGEETESEPSEETEAETLPYDPTLHPGDSSLYEGVLIHSVYGTGKRARKPSFPTATCSSTTTPTRIFPWRARPSTTRVTEPIPSISSCSLPRP